ncbi:MAG: peptide chain release factor 1, partial [Desulfovibrio sp.]|nr:peptide chain release factor 1 [Desulfovibrio sp.]
MFAKLEEIEHSFLDLEKELGAPEVLADKDRYRKVAKSHADLGAIVRAFREYK